MVHSRILLIGPMGAGKSSVAIKLATLLQVHFVDTDHLICEMLKSNISDIFKQYGEAYFRRQELKVLRNVLRSEIAVVATGGGIVLHPEIPALISASDLVCYLKVSPQQQLQRLSTDVSRPLLPMSLQRLDFFEQIAIARNHLYEKIATITIDTECSDIEQIALEIAKYANNRK